jgi:hypothetical protein
MSYSDLGATRGISRSSAERLARRQRWPRQVGNDGFARVLVPVEWTSLTDASPDVMARRSDALAVLRVAVETLRGQLAQADKREGAHATAVAALREQLEVANARADRAEAGRGEAAEQLAELRVALDQARAGAQAARDRADALTRESEARKGRGLRARLMAAWRGE